MEEAQRGDSQKKLLYIVIAYKLHTLIIYSQNFELNNMKMFKYFCEEEAAEFLELSLLLWGPPFALLLPGISSY